MSDFDKEAERRKLREKYERDKKKRKATQRMSELLLQGATMTNQHCDSCGDPIFRYEGQEFCPTCQSASAEAEAETGAEGDADPDDTSDVSVDVSTAEDDEANEQRPAAKQDAASSNDSGTKAPDSEQKPEQRTAHGRTTGESQTTKDDSSDVTATDDSLDVEGGEQASRAAVRETGVSGSDVDGTDELSTARATVQRVLLQQARAAETANDPRQAREHLTATREAAETLAALRRNR